MKNCLQEKNFVLRFSIHRTTIFVAPNRLHPGHELLPGTSQPQSGTQQTALKKVAGDSGPSAKTLKNARKRRRASERKRASIARSQVEPIPSLAPLSTLENSSAPVRTMSSCTQMASFSSALSASNSDVLPTGCVEPETFWALPRPDRLEYRKQLRTLLGKVPTQFLCPSADDCLTMNAARQMRENGNPLELVVTYPQAVAGAAYRQNSSQ